jgi:hypothetical protein
MADKAIVSYGTDFNNIPYDDSKALVLVQPKPLVVVPLKQVATVPQHHEQAYYIQDPFALPPPPARLLLQGGAKGKQIAIPKGTLLLPPRDNERLLSVQTDKKGKLVCTKYTTARPAVQGIHTNPNEVCYIEHITPKPKPKCKRAAPPILRTLNENHEGLSDIVKGMEKSNNMRDKLIEGMDNQLGISLKLICSLRRDKDKLEAEVAAL